jgi:DNA helicase-2/ATP-dependent DNA helicase PcrA
VTVDRAAQFAQAQRIPLFEALRRLPDVPGAPSAARPAVAGLVELVDAVRARLATDGAGAARDLVEKVGLIDDLRKGSTTALAAQRRCDNVFDFLKSLDERQKREPGQDSLREYLHFLSLNAKDDDDKDKTGDEVTMTTLHGAKGLEWPVVFLVGFEEELLPHARTLYPQGPDCDGEADVSEERRLAYVGITRARERLYLSRALVRHKHGRDRARTPSRFLLEIPAELLTQRDLLAEVRAPVNKNELVGFFRGFLDK